MTLFSYFAVFFIIWWTVLFATLPFGLRTQDDSGEIVPGTVSSAPHGRHMMKVVIRNTIVSVIIFAVLWWITKGLGYGIDDIPRIVPDFG